MTSSTTRDSTVEGGGPEITILFENDRLLAVDKPHGISHHDDPHTGELGMISLLRQRHQWQSSSTRLYGVHRLDRVTSGILLLAKERVTASALSDKFRMGNVTKYYAGVSGRRPRKKKQGWVRGVMTKGRRGCYKLLNGDVDDDDDYARWSRTDGGDGVGHTTDVVEITTGEEGGRDLDGQDDGYDIDDGADDDDDIMRGGAGSSGGRRGGNVGYASTRFYTAGLGNLILHPSLMSVIDDDKAHGDNVGGSGRIVGAIPRTAILFRPQTGKTHQLRVAAKSLSMPILGDLRYGGGRLLVGTAVSSSSSSSSSSSPPDRQRPIDNEDPGDLDRTYLHASAVHFELDERESVTIWSPPPFDRLAMGLDSVYVRLMEKHCDCPPILDAICKRPAMDRN